MVYEQPADVREVQAPVEMNAIIRANNKDVGDRAQKQTALDASNSAKNKNYTSSVASRVDIAKFAQHLKGITARTSSQACARSIRIALEKAGARFQNHPVAAADWGSTLMQLGYRKINAAFDQPKEGDIYIINRTRSHAYGHIAGYSGSGWVSDFKQSGYAVYKNDKVNYSYYRMQD